MTGVVLLWPAWWPVLLLLPASAWVLRRAARAVDAARARALGTRARAVAGQPAFVRTRGALAAAAGAMATVALLQPVVPGAGDAAADVVVCIDVSWSMAARDAAPTRLGAVQRELDALVADLRGSRLALVAFGGDATLVMPLSCDGVAAQVLARDLVAGAAGAPGTDPGAAIDLAVALLQRAPGPGSIVVATDGEDFAGTGRAAAARAAAAGARVFALGVGDPAGSKIVVTDEGGETFLRDGAGAEVVTRLELDALRTLAAAGGGRLLAATGARLAELHAGELLPAARAAALRAGRAVAVPRYHGPLLAALLLWMLRACLPERRR